MQINEALLAHRNESRLNGQNAPPLELAVERKLPHVRISKGKERKLKERKL
jgi:hypothetical protein